MAEEFILITSDEEEIPIEDNIWNQFSFQESKVVLKSTNFEMLDKILISIESILDTTKTNKIDSSIQSVKDILSLKLDPIDILDIKISAKELQLNWLIEFCEWKANLFRPTTKSTLTTLDSLKELELSLISESRIPIRIGSYLFDLKPFESTHPGGQKILEDYTGFTSSSAAAYQFEINHKSGKSKDLLRKFFIGTTTVPISNDESSEKVSNELLEQVQVSINKAFLLFE